MKKRGSVTYSTDRENDVIKYISEVNRARGKGITFKFSGQYSEIPRVLTERCNKTNDYKITNDKRLRFVRLKHCSVL